MPRFFICRATRQLKAGESMTIGEIRLALVGFFDQMLEQAVDLGQMAEDFGDADDGEIFRVDHGIAASGAHAVSADAEEFESAGRGGARLRGAARRTFLRKLRRLRSGFAREHCKRT